MNRRIEIGGGLAAACAICPFVLGSALLAACGSSRPTVVTTPSSAARFYLLPHPLPRRPAGTLIRAERVPLPLHPPATIWRILYHSRSASGRDMAVSGFAIVPASAAKGVRPVYAWAHGSSGQADRCAPSRDFPDNLPPYGGRLVGRNAVLVATDYQGLGTPGEPTPYVGVAEAHAILDGIRAAKQLRGVGRLGPVVIAAQLAHTYAPSLDLRGVVALATD